MGQAFGKQFDKKTKAAVSALTNDQIRAYIKNGTVEVNGLNVTEGMLKISKSFNKEYESNPQYATASSMLSSVMLDKVLTEDLKMIGLSREVTNRIQRLRKTSGITIDDQIEIFYSFADESKHMAQVVTKYQDKMYAQTRMSVLPLKHKQGEPKVVGNTEFVHPEDESDRVDILIVFA